MQEQEIKFTGIKPTSVALFEGVFGAILGVAVSITYLFGGIFAYSSATNSLLQGLLLGFSIGIMSLFILPIIYFAVGWVIGLVHGWVFNLVLRASGGIALDVAVPEEQIRTGGSRAGQSQTVFGERIEPRK